MKVIRRIAPLFVVLAVGCAADPGVDGEEGELSGDPNSGDESAPDPQSEELGVTVAAALSSGLIDTEEAAFLTLINQHRAASGAGALRISITLSNAAQGHASDMATKNYFSHTSQDGRSFADRINAAGYPGGTIAENIAAGNSTASGTFTQWKNSSGHNTNMLNSAYRVIGIGRASNLSSTYGWYWVTTFGDAIDAVTSHGTGTILANGGMESAFAGAASWNTVKTRGNWYTQNASRTSSGPQSGTYRASVNDPSTGAAALTQIVLARPNVAYTFTAASRRLSGTTGQSLYLEFLDSSYTRLVSTTAPAAAGSTYATASVSRLAPAGTRYVRVFAYGSTASGTASQFAYDNAKLEAQ